MGLLAQSLPARHELLLEEFPTCIQCVWDASLCLKTFVIPNSYNLLQFLNLLNCAIEKLPYFVRNVFKCCWKVNFHTIRTVSQYCEIF